MCAKKRLNEQIFSELEQIGKKRDDEKENENEQLHVQMEKFASKDYFSNFSSFWSIYKFKKFLTENLLMLRCDSNTNITTNS